jgi:RND family efflux transporter MFP subunit
LRTVVSKPPQSGEAFGGAPVAVRVAEAELGALALINSYPGELVGEIADIAPQVGGLLRLVPVRLGDRVVAGQELAVVDDLDLRNQIEEARGQLGVALANQRRAAAELVGIEADHRRAADLFREQLISEQEFDRVEAQRASGAASLAAAEAQTEQGRARLVMLEQQLIETRVVAPFAGTVAARYLDPGALVQRGTAILRLVEDKPLWVQFRVPEGDLGAVAPGNTFSATTRATGASAFTGVVRRIAGEISRTDRTAIVEGQLQEVMPLLRPGMYADVSVQLDELRGALLVPGEAVLERVRIDGSQDTGVFVVDGEVDGETARWAPVTITGAARGLRAVSGALSAGDRVLTLGHADLRDGASIRVVAGPNQPDRQDASR